MSRDFETDTVEAPATALVVFQPNNLVAFNDGVLDAAEKVAAEARVCVAGADASTEIGRDIIRSTAYRVAQSKVALDDLGKKLTEEHKRIAVTVDASRRNMREKLDAVKEEIRKPLTEFEEAEARRKNDHENELSMIEMLLDFSAVALTVNELKFRLAKLRGLPSRDWQEFKMRAQETMTRVERHLCTKLDAAELAEREAAAKAARDAELARIAQEERDERIARAAAEKATRDAEEKAAWLGMVHEAENSNVIFDQHRREEKAEREKHAAEERARLADERAEREIKQALEREAKRLADEKAAADAAAAKREANKAHRGKINREARNAIIAALERDNVACDSLAIAISVAVVTAIAKGEIPHVTISY